MTTIDPTVAQLNGLPLLRNVTWPLRAGVEPISTEVTVTLQASGELLPRGSGPVPAALALSAGGQRMDILGLFIVQRLPGTNSFEPRLRVVDRRWFWRYGRIKRRYNVRRRVGYRRLSNPGTKPINPVTDQVAFAPFSTKTGQGSVNDRWTARDVLDDVMQAIIEFEGQYGSDLPGYTVGTDLSSLNDLPIEDLELDDTLDAALRRVLSYIPSAAVSVDRQGRIHVYAQARGDEAQDFEDSGQEMVNRGHAEEVDFSALRPSSIRIHFAREIELRFDFREGDRTFDRDGRWMQNVLPVPDYELRLASGETVAQGTWITVEQAIDAWNADRKGNIGPMLTPDVIRQAFVPYMDLWGALRLSGNRAGDADWGARIAALQQHFRQTFRINRRWLDRLLTIKATRVATIDPTTGTRSPAMAWSDFAYLGSQRSLLMSALGGGQLNYVTNVPGYPPSGTINAESRPAPVNVSVLDSDQGIIHLDYLVDVKRVYDMVFPGRVEMTGGGETPSMDITNARRTPIAFDALAENSNSFPTLAAQHQVAVIVTGIAGSPNSEAQFHRIERTPEQVLALIPEAAREDAQQSRGPRMDIFISANFETARIAWSDGDEGLIDSALGIGGVRSYVDLTELCINAGANVGGASLEQIANAAAARIWAMMSNRWMGSKSVSFLQGARPRGWMREVNHTIEESGVGTTQLIAPDTIPPIDLFAFLGDGVRHHVLKLVAGGR